VPTTEVPTTWEDWPLEAKRRFLRQLRRHVLGGWREKARPDQLPPDHLWTTLLLRGGRGSGKTWAGAHTFAELIEDDPYRESEGPGDWGVVAPTFAEARDKCIESKESGLLKAFGTSRQEVERGQSAIVATWNRSIGEMILRDGSRVLIDGADDGAPSIQGENLRAVWADEIGLWKKWQMAWDESIGMAVRKGEAKRIATGTPKRIMPARQLMRKLINDPNVVTRRLRTLDNLDNLAQSFIDTIVTPVLGTEFGRQEVEGELLEDVEGALWKRTWFDHPTFRVSAPPRSASGAKLEWQRRPITGVDPSDGLEDGAEHAYATSALGMDHDLYVIASAGSRKSPYEFAREVIHHSARVRSEIVVEKNHGGQWLVDTFKRAMSDLGVQRPLRAISAAQGKRTRAEPISALYEPRILGTEELPGRVHHVGEPEQYEELEDQLTGWTGAPNEPSPDRLDSLVWSLWDFRGASFKPPPPEDEDRAVPYRDEPPKRLLNTPHPKEPIEEAVAWR
jgi:phage terminase large subunit-like protein